MDKAILLVDDEQGNIDALTRLFRRDYHVFTSSSGEDALDLLAQEDIQLIISDQRMPRMTGVEFFAKSMKVKPKAIRILLTGYADMDSLMSAINQGQIYRYISKPWDSIDLKTAVSNGLERYDLEAALEEKNNALAQAIQKLQELDEAKTRFMMLVNHELKTPLTGISSFLSLLQESQLDEEQILFVSRIDRNTQRLHKMVEDVMQLISAQTGQLDIHVHPLASQDVLDELIEDFREAANKRRLDLVIENQAEKVSADRNILQKVLWRLTDNAIKFADESSQVKITTIEKDDGAEFVLENKGQIEPERMAKLLEPFTLGEEMMNHSQGLGLGLSISDALLKNHQSQLKIESEDDTVRIRFHLPREV